MRLHLGMESSLNCCFQSNVQQSVGFSSNDTEKKNTSHLFISWNHQYQYFQIHEAANAIEENWKIKSKKKEDIIEEGTKAKQYKFHGRSEY